MAYMLEIARVLYIKSAPISCEIVIFYRHIDNWTIIQTFCLWAARPNLLSLHKWAFGPLNCFFFVENGSLMLVTAKERPIIAKSYWSIPFQTISLRGLIRQGHGQNWNFWDWFKWEGNERFKMCSGLFVYIHM